MSLSNIEMMIPVTHRVIECLLLIIKLLLSSANVYECLLGARHWLSAGDTVVNKTGTVLPSWCSYYAITTIRTSK